MDHWISGEGAYGEYEVLFNQGSQGFRVYAIGQATDAIGDAGGCDLSRGMLHFMQLVTVGAPPSVIDDCRFTSIAKSRW